MNDINKLIISQTNTSYQLLQIKKKLDWILTDPERFRLRVKRQKKLIELKKVQDEVLTLFNKII